MPRGSSHVLQVVVLAPNSQALLRGHCAGIVALLLPQKDLFELHHARVGEQQARVVPWGTRGEESTGVWPCSLKNSMNLCLISLAVITVFSRRTRTNSLLHFRFQVGVAIQALPCPDVPTICFLSVGGLRDFPAEKRARSHAPCPRRSDPKANQEPLLSTMLASTPMSRISPSRETPVPYRMSKQASRKGGATLFFTTLTRARIP